MFGNILRRRQLCLFFYNLPVLCEYIYVSMLQLNYTKNTFAGHSGVLVSFHNNVTGPQVVVVQVDETA
jgi:hypothetical protein